jgi:hypothetical protein
MGDLLIERGPEGFDCTENDESLPTWVPQAVEPLAGAEEAERRAANRGTGDRRAPHSPGEGDVRHGLGRVSAAGGGVLNNRVAVDAGELLRLAQCVDDEIDLDGVAAALRGIAQDPDADITEALERTRRAGQGEVTGGGENCCSGRYLCAYHEGWSDALDLLEDELS